MQCYTLSLLAFTKIGALPLLMRTPVLPFPSSRTLLIPTCERMFQNYIMHVESYFRYIQNRCQSWMYQQLRNKNICAKNATELYLLLKILTTSAALRIILLGDLRQPCSLSLNF